MRGEEEEERERGPLACMVNSPAVPSHRIGSGRAALVLSRLGHGCEERLKLGLREDSQLQWAAEASSPAT